MCFDLESKVPCIRTYNFAPNEITDNFIRVRSYRKFRGDVDYSVVNGRTIIIEHNRIAKLILALLGEKNPPNKIGNCSVNKHVCLDYCRDKLNNYGIQEPTICNMTRSLVRYGYVSGYGPFGSWSNFWVHLTSKGERWLADRGM